MVERYGGIFGNDFPALVHRIHCTIHIHRAVAREEHMSFIRAMKM